MRRDIEDAEVVDEDDDVVIVGAYPPDKPAAANRQSSSVRVPRRGGAPVKPQWGALIPFVGPPIADALLVDKKWLKSTPAGAWWTRTFGDGT